MTNKILSIKLTRLPIKKLKNKNLPKNATTFNLVNGFSTKKGNFKVISFFDKNDNLIEIQSKHINEKNIIKTTNTYSANKMVITSTIENNENITSQSKKVIHPDYFFTEEINLPNEEYSLHILGRLKKRQLPKIISYLTFWDGQKPIISYQNINTKLKSDKGLELLPLLISSFRENCIKHLSKYRIREEKLEGVASVAKSISLDDAIKDFQITKDYMEVNGKISGITDTISGQVYIIRENNNNVDLIDTIAHEYQHVKDASDILRLEDNYKLPTTPFEKLSKKKDKIKKSDSEYNVLWQLIKEKTEYYSNCNNKNHDNMMIEQRAIAKGKEQTDLFFSIISTIKDLLHNH